VTPAVGQATAGRDSHAEFVKRVGADLRLGGGKFRFAGSNQYYLIYKSPFMVDDVLEAADAQGFHVMRIWGSLDIGDLNDGSTSVGGGAPRRASTSSAGIRLRAGRRTTTARTASSGSTTRSPRPASWASGS